MSQRLIVAGGVKYWRGIKVTSNDQGCLAEYLDAVRFEREKESPAGCFIPDSGGRLRQPRSVFRADGVWRVLLSTVPVVGRPG